MVDTSKHPCFNVGAKGLYGRIHLPVAPKCNIQCNYCNRKYDCVNESRPGVTSAVLGPAQAVHYVEQVIAKEPRISTIGIAGPGDPLANAYETLETMRRVRAKFPELIFCLSTNGLALPPHCEEIAKIGVSHVTVTVNAVDPEIGAKIYSWVRDGKVLYHGVEAAKLLLSRQLEGIKKLKELGVTVKTNTIFIPGLNDHHVEEVAVKMKELGVDLHNLLGLIPTEGTSFAEVPSPKNQELSAMRDKLEKIIPQMKHCRRCRADAVGLLDNDRSKEFSSCLKGCSTMTLTKDEERPYVAVASREGILVNQHLGEATTFQIWAKEGDEFKKISDRPSPKTLGGPQRWYDLAATLKDCKAVLCQAVGETPRTVLEEEGLPVYTMNGLISQGLDRVFSGKDLSAFQPRQGKSCAGGGKGGGCV